MKPKSKKMSGLLAVLLCAVCILCKPFGYTFAAGADTAPVNGWTAVKSNDAADDWTDNVELKYSGEGITKIHTTHFKYGAAVNRKGLKPIRKGKFSIDIDFDLEKTNIPLWGAIYIPIVWDCYIPGNETNLDVSNTNNGLLITLGKYEKRPNECRTGWKIALSNRETGKECYNGNWGDTSSDIDLSKTLHIVIETIGSNTNIYVNGRLYGTTQLTESSSYLWLEGSKPTIAIGAGANWEESINERGDVYATIDTHAPDSTETLQALIDACDRTTNPAAPADMETAFRDAVEQAKNAIYGEEPVVLESIKELTSAKQTYDAYVRKGDFDNDGEVSASDLILLRKHLLGITAVDEVLGDINGDKGVDILDLIHLKKIIAKGSQGSGTDQVSQTVTVSVSDYAWAGDDNNVLQYAINDVVWKANAAQSRGENTRYILKLEKKTYRLESTLVVYAGKNVTFDGNGATLVWTELISALQVQDCTNVTFRDFSMDYDPLPFTQGVVTSVSGNTVQVTVDEGYRTDITNILPDGNGYMTIHDRYDGAPLPGTANFYYPENARYIGGRDISFTMDWQDPYSKPVAAGDVVCLFNRSGETVTLNNCAGTQFIRMNMYSSPGFLFNEGHGAGGTVLKNCQIVPGSKPAGASQNRLRSSNGDASHFGNVKKGPTLDGCRITHSGDDCINVQGFFYHVVKVSGKTVWVTPKWDTGAFVGDTVEGYEKTSYSAIGTAKITAVERQHDASLKEEIKNAYDGVAGGYQSEDLVYQITLDKDLGFKLGDHITSLDSIGSGVTIRNSIFGYNTARCVVVKGHDVVVENCTFERCSAAAIMALADLNWCESGFPVNVRIENNRIDRCSTSGAQRDAGDGNPGAIFIGNVPLYKTEGFLNNYECKNILIEKNTITDCQVYGIFTSNCDGITIQSNIISNPFVNGIGNVGALYGLTPNSGIFVGMSKNITVTGNTVAGGGRISQAVEIYSNCSGAINNSNNDFK